MRKLIAVVASTAALLIAGMANAAPTQIIFEQQGGAGSNTWQLSINVTEAVSLAAVVFAIESSPVGDFVITAANTSVDAFAPVGFSAKNVAGNVLSLLLQSGSQGAINGPLASPAQGVFVLGTLTAPAGFTFIPDENTGGTVQDTDFNSLPFELVIIPPPVPEPAAMVLLGLGLAGLALARRAA
jgi:hypothetical protein